VTAAEGSIEALVVDDGEGLVGLDCREVLSVEEGEQDGPFRYRVRLGRRGGEERLLPCRDVVGFLPLSRETVRPVPTVLAERLPPSRRPWAVGIHPRGVFLLY
jgi:hypothetical protein